MMLTDTHKCLERVTKDLKKIIVRVRVNDSRQRGILESENLKFVNEQYDDPMDLETRHLSIFIENKEQLPNEKRKQC